MMMNNVKLKIFIPILLVVISCKPPVPPVPVERHTDDSAFDYSKDSALIATKPVIDSVFTPQMRLQFNMIHHDSTFDFDSRVAKVPALVKRIDAEFRFIEMVHPDTNVYSRVIDEYFNIDDVRDDSFLEDEILTGVFKECALNINVVPKGVGFSGYTVPGYYPDENGQVVWVNYDVFDLPRSVEWITTVQHEICHALGEKDLVDENGERFYDYAIHDNIASNANRRDTFNIDQEVRMYNFLIYLREDWWRECESYE